MRFLAPRIGGCEKCFFSVFLKKRVFWTFSATKSMEKSARIRKRDFSGIPGFQIGGSGTDFLDLPGGPKKWIPGPRKSENSGSENVVFRGLKNHFFGVQESRKKWKFRKKVGKVSRESRFFRAGGSVRKKAFSPD